MEIILAIATILGGITAIWFFWDKLTQRWKSYFDKPARLTNAEKVSKRETLRPIFEDKLLEIKAKKLASDVIIRDVDRVDSYPDTSDELGISSWFRLGLLETYHRGIRVALRIGNLTETPDGYRFTDHKKESGSIKVWLVGEIPFESIESVNWSGDEYYGKPHIYCHFEYAKGEPYERLVFCEERKLDDIRYFSEVAEYDEVSKRSKEAGVEYFS